MTSIYLVLGALTFWALVATALLVGSIYAVEWWADRTQRREIGDVIDPFTRTQTDRIARQWGRHLT